MLACAFKSK
jgi:hypothetical protein